jgi:hypothetical protein
MRILVCILAILIFSSLPVSSLAQIEPEPEVDVLCTNYYDESVTGHPKLSDYGVFIYCTLENDNMYEVEVETDLQWMYTDDHDSSTTISLASGEELDVYFQLFVTKEAQPGMEVMTFEVRVVEYGTVRECTGCEATSHSLDIEVDSWTSVDLTLLSENPEGTFGLTKIREFQQCQYETDYQFNARVEVDGNHAVTPGIGFDHDTFLDSYGYPEAGSIRVETPSLLELGIGAGQSTEIEVSISLEVVNSQQNDVFVVFIMVLGEVEEINNYLQDSDSNGLDFYYGGCVVKGGSVQDSRGNEPIIIEASSDNSQIYLIAGIGGATTICLLIALVVILLRNRQTFPFDQEPQR